MRILLLFALFLGGLAGQMHAAQEKELEITFLDLPFDKKVEIVEQLIKGEDFLFAALVLQEVRLTCKELRDAADYVAGKVLSKILTQKEAQEALWILIDRERLTPFQLGVLMKSGASLEVEDERDNRYPNYNTRGTALTKAIKHLNRDAARMLLNAGAKFDKFQLHQAVIYQACDILGMLIAKGANVDLQNFGGETALMNAAENGRADLVKQLIDAGAKLDLQDNEGQTALMWAAGNSPEIVPLLIKAGADQNIKDNVGKTYLDHKR